MNADDTKDIASIIGSQSVSGVQRFANPYGATAQYTRHSSVLSLQSALILHNVVLMQSRRT